MLKVLVVAAVLLFAPSALAAQTPQTPRTVPARDGDVVVVEGNDVVRFVRRRDAEVRAIFDASARRLVLFVDYAVAGQAPDGRVDEMHRFEEIAPSWPFGDRWQGRATLYEYSAVTAAGAPTWFGLSTPQGLVQFGRAQDLSPFGGETPIASLAFRHGGRSRVPGVPFDEAERQTAQGMPGPTRTAESSQAAVTGQPSGVHPGGVQPVRVGGNIRPPNKIHDVRPVYPEVAMANRVTGLVIMEALIGVDGSVSNVTVLKGEPILRDAAVEAVRQWRFETTYLNGVPVPVIMTVTVSFNLQ